MIWAVTMVVLVALATVVHVIGRASQRSALRRGRETWDEDTFLREMRFTRRP